VAGWMTAERIGDGRSNSNWLLNIIIARSYTRKRMPQRGSMLSGVTLIHGAGLEAGAGCDA
jgi:hypothetical protein